MPSPVAATLVGLASRYLLPPTVPGACATLGSARLPVDVKAAARYLDATYDTIRILGLYRHYFPAQWAAATARSFTAEDEVYSPREIEFFQLVHTQLFPLYLPALFGVEDWDDEEAEEYTRSAQILIEPWGLDWYEDGENVSVVWRGLLVLAGELDARLLDDTPFAGVLQLKLHAAGQRTVDYAQLRAACRARTDVLVGLPDALDMIRHETGSVWYDATWDDMANYAIMATWRQEDIDWLAQGYRRALDIDTRVDPLLDWLGTDAAHWGELLKLWKQHSPGRGA